MFSLFQKHKKDDKKEQERKAKAYTKERLDQAEAESGPVFGCLYLIKSMEEPLFICYDLLMSCTQDDGIQDQIDAIQTASMKELLESMNQAKKEYTEGLLKNLLPMYYGKLFPIMANHFQRNSEREYPFTVRMALEAYFQFYPDIMEEFVNLRKENPNVKPDELRRFCQQELEALEQAVQEGLQSEDETERSLPYVYRRAARGFADRHHVPYQYFDEFAEKMG